MSDVTLSAPRRTDQPKWFRESAVRRISRYAPIAAPVDTRAYRANISGGNV